MIQLLGHNFLKYSTVKLCTNFKCKDQNQRYSDFGKPSNEIVG